MSGMRPGDEVSQRRVVAIQLGLLAGFGALLAGRGLAELPTAAAVQWPVLLLALGAALLVERVGRHRGPAGVVAGWSRLERWVSRQLTDGWVHAHEEGEPCNAACCRSRPLEQSPS